MKSTRNQDFKKYLSNKAPLLALTGGPILVFIPQAFIKSSDPVHVLEILAIEALIALSAYLVLSKLTFQIWVGLAAALPVAVAEAAPSWHLFQSFNAILCFAIFANYCAVVLSQYHS